MGAAVGEGCSEDVPGSVVADVDGLGFASPELVVDGVTGDSMPDLDGEVPARTTKATATTATTATATATIMTNPRP